MKNEQTLNKLKKFELGISEQKNAKGGYAPSCTNSIISIGRRHSIWGEVEVRRPIRRMSIVNNGVMTKGGSRRIGG
jgi:hypothetical protein